MTLLELKKKIDALGLPVAYRFFAVGQVPELPYIVYYADEDVGFFADDIVYYEDCAVTIEAYSTQKDLGLETKIKKLLTDNQLPYESYEDFLDSENMYLKAYEFNI
ncbi:MAG: hypothetical protein MSA90_13065 [Faecalicatena sp.]|uniref:hypothetical protein n=1 Tax=Faecalicatena sp. TaxID=2005360 RepID=UPI0025903448|nr:hypothetical protein [Faecalicatena sp.]MCI6466385.1 hypothetical protein [Faecalicatena sp.]MCI7182356.1 hypothetical protein [Lachnospiraceae bacterium]MDY5619021.1 hypothetical protein [Lachnospiraceae bacterium]